MLNKDKFATSDIIQITIHNPELKPRGSSSFPVVVSRTVTVFQFDLGDGTMATVPLQDGYFTLTYATTSLQLLKYPYSTDCINYDDVEYESQGDCVDTCQL